MKFDVVIGNPPYNASTANGKATGKTIYGDFVKAALRDVKSGGYICYVHPSGWRKPGSRMKLWDKMRRLRFLRLEIYGSKAGKETFGVGTRYDWYVLQNSPLDSLPQDRRLTDVKPESGARTRFSFSDWPWLPNDEFELIDSILAKPDSVPCGSGERVLEETCPVICNSAYHSARKDICSKTEGGEFIHPVLHARTKKATRWFWANTRDRGHFGVPKVMFGDSAIHDPLIDLEGKWGMTEHAMAIELRRGSKEEMLEEARLIRSALLSQGFSRILSACRWSNFQIDWRMFASFRRDWYLEFLNE